MGNQCGNICKGDQTLNPNHKVIKQFQQATQNQATFKLKRAITNTHQIAYPLSTNGIRIVDGFGRRVKLSFVTWRGCETIKYCVDGLETESIETICEKTKQLGFNGVRLLYSVEMVVKNPIVKDMHLIQGSQFINKHALSILDVVINRITKSGLMVILSNQCSSPCTTLTTEDGEGLWWTDKYSQFQWLDSIKKIVQRYTHNPRVVGYELRTHIRGTSRVTPTWGDNNIMTDWRRAAQVCAKQILNINQHCLILIGGLNYGCQLKSIKDYPLDEVIKSNNIVYCGSFMTKHWDVLSWRLQKYQSFVKQVEDNLLCIRNRNHPIFLNTFSYEYEIPWGFLVKFLEESDLDWCFWYLDLYKAHSNNGHGIRLHNEEIRKVLSKITKSNCGSPQETEYQTSNLPPQMISSNLVQINHPTGYNYYVDQLLDSTPGGSLDQIRPQNNSRSQFTDRNHHKPTRGQIYIDQQGNIQKPAQVIKQSD